MHGFKRLHLTSRKNFKLWRLKSVSLQIITTYKSMDKKFLRAELSISEKLFRKILHIILQEIAFL